MPKQADKCKVLEPYGYKNLGFFVFFIANKQPIRLSRRGVWRLKAGLHLLFLLPLLWLLYCVVNGELGGDPVQYIIHFTGKGALNVLILTLLVSPLSKGLKAGFLMECRRLIGLWSFAYAFCHLLAFVSLDLLFAFEMLLSEVIKRPYLSVGALSFMLLLILAVTSLSVIRRQLGKHWQLVHNLIYLAAPLILIHYIWSVKSGLIEPMIYLVLLSTLLGSRYSRFLRKSSK